MIDNNDPKPSDVFDKKVKKPGLLAGLFGKKEDPLDYFYEEDELSEEEREYDDMEKRYYEKAEKIPEDAPSTVRRKAILLLEDNREEEDFDKENFLPYTPKKKSGLLGLLESNEEEEEKIEIPPPVVEEAIIAEDSEEEDCEIKEANGYVDGEDSETSETKDEELLFGQEQEEVSRNNEKEEQEESSNISSSTVEQEKSYRDTVEEAVQNELEPLETRADILASAGYVEIIETLATKVMLHHEIPNISLESFGAVASTYEPNTLEITLFGKHKFVGNPLTNKQKIFLFSQIEKAVEKSREENNAEVRLSATQKVVHEGIIYRTLLLSDDLLEDYMNAYNRTIMTNGDAGTLQELSVIIKL